MNTVHFIAAILRQSRGKDEFDQAYDVFMALFNAGYTIQIREDWNMSEQEQITLARAVMLKEEQA